MGWFLVHGYHPWTEDAEIYLPGVEKTIHSALFPAFPEFFQYHAHLTLFPRLLAASVGLTGLPLEWVLLVWQFAAAVLTTACLLGS